jgi:chromosome segregation ATPase
MQLLFNSQQQITQVLKDNEALESSLHSLTQEFELHKSKYNNEVVVELSNALQERDNTIISLKKVIGQFNIDKEECDRIIKRQEEEIAQLVEDAGIAKAQKEKEAKKFNEVINEYKEKVRTLEIEIENKSEILTVTEKYETKVLELEQVIQSLKDKNLKLINESNTIRKECQEQCLNLENEITKHKAELNEVKESNGKLKTESGETMEELRLLLKQYQKTNQNLLSELKTKESSLNTWKNYTTELQQQLQEQANNNTNEELL